eukprot:TRINITY_DN74211_c0_g1_i1.p1 TRINITY_DN74211_c0_g1~~TRINITY_DN74211_c0_g1_i1.p1  ORF type:complete len:271 (-),score=33.52 TRINITY_DN74211_c0_g1_i1:82-894(-)
MVSDSSSACVISSPDDVVSLDVGGLIFKTWRSTLISKSKYFRALLSGNFKDDGREKPLFVDADPDIFKHILEYCRSHRLTATAPLEEVMSFASRYAFDDLEEQAKICLTIGKWGLLEEKKPCCVIDLGLPSSTLQAGHITVVRIHDLVDEKTWPYDCNCLRTHFFFMDSLDDESIDDLSYYFFELGWSEDDEQIIFKRDDERSMQRKLIVALELYGETQSTLVFHVSAAVQQQEAGDASLSFSKSCDSAEDIRKVHNSLHWECTVVLAKK